jgi:exo-beta-1,3-glucanase (GH17 family)
VIVIAVAVGVSVSHNSSKSSSASSSSSGSGAVNQSDPNDPSTFTKDSRLKQSFWAMAYTPKGSQLPACGNTLEGVIEDIQLMSQLTTRLRLYGSDCNQSALVVRVFPLYPYSRLS